MIRGVDPDDHKGRHPKSPLQTGNVCLVTKHVDVSPSGHTVSNMFDHCPDEQNDIQCLIKCLVTKQCLIANISRLERASPHDTPLKSSKCVSPKTCSVELFRVQVVVLKRRQTSSCSSSRHSSILTLACFIYQLLYRLVTPCKLQGCFPFEISAFYTTY